MRVIIQEEALRRSEGHYYRHFIQELPTIDAVPVVHGRWIERKSIHADGGVVTKCSICKKDIQYLGQRLKFCPNCGAKMDAEESTND